MNTAVCSLPEVDQDISFSDEVLRSRDDRVYMYIRSLPKTAKVLLGTREDALSDDGPFSKELREIGSYRLNMIEFLGFDFVGPLPEDDEGLIFPIYDSSKGNGCPERVHELTDCSVWAIDVYNKIHGTEFGNVQVLKANAHPRSQYAYFITFKATNQKGKTKTFQGMVSTEINVPGKLVELVRIKPPFKPYPHTTTTLGQVIAFSDEKGVRFQSTFLGSGAIAGILPVSSLHIRDKSDVPVEGALKDKSIEMNEETLSHLKYNPESVFTYVEIHIEQGPVLESVGLPLGVVKGIAGQTRLKVTERFPRTCWYRLYSTHVNAPGSYACCSRIDCIVGKSL